MTALAIGVCLCLVLSAVNAVLLAMLLARKPEPKPKIGRPRGSRNRAPAPTLVQQAQNYFGPPVEPKKPVDPEELAALIKFVNEGKLADEEQMIDPNDEMRVGTGYAGT